MSSSQTNQAFTSITNALCDRPVNTNDLATLISKATTEEQIAIQEFVRSYIRNYAMNHEIGNFINDNMDIAKWAWDLANGIDNRTV